MQASVIIISKIY